MAKEVNAENPMAVDSEVTLSDGSIKRLSELWSGAKLVLVFLRHFG